MSSLFKQLRIERIISEAPEVKTFVLAPVPASDRFSWKAGQFLTLVFDGLNEEERRSFSISAAPGEPLAITVKRVENGAYSRLLIDNAAVGDILKTTGAAGFFTLPDTELRRRQIFLFAAGSGITPCFSIIKHALHHSTAQLHLVYSNRSETHTIFLNELRQLRNAFPDRFSIDFLMSDAKNLAFARLSKQLVADILRAAARTPVGESLFFICGPFDYMRMVHIALVTAGVPDENIKQEDFLPLKIEPKVLPPDTDPHEVFVEINEQTHALRARYPETILSAAKKAGLPMPYSCMAGRCGACVAICTQGKVWMHRNEVLTDDELARGMVLTCTAYPVGGDVHLRV